MRNDPLKRVTCAVIAALGMWRICSLQEGESPQPQCVQKEQFAPPKKTPKCLRVSSLPGHHRAPFWPCKTSRDRLKKSRCISQQILVFRCCFWRLTESCSQASFARHRGWQRGWGRAVRQDPPRTGSRDGLGTKWAPNASGH